MRRFAKILGWGFLIIFGLLFVVVLTISSDTIDGNIKFYEASLPESSSEIPGWIANQELHFSNIRPGEAKRIIWAGAVGEKTPLAVIYLHGFSASSEEIRPVPDQVAKALGANLFFTRLTGHGQNGAAMGEASAEDWLRDTAEALAIGRRLGDRVLVIATSTGGTLAAVAAQDAGMARDVAGVVMISPNFGVRPLVGRLLDLPFVQTWGPWLVGEELGFDPLNPAHGAHWTTRYPTRAVFPMSVLVHYARGLNYRGVTLPLLVLISPQDQVVSPDRTRAVVAGWGGPVQIVERQMGPGDDPYAHVLAGDILSPGQTAATVDLILSWARGLR